MDRTEARLRDWERRLEIREDEFERLAIFLHDRIGEVAKRAADLARAADKALAAARGRESLAAGEDARPSGLPPAAAEADGEPGKAPTPIRAPTVEQALLRAAQLGATGSDPEQIRDLLRRDLGEGVAADEAVARLLGLDDRSSRG